MEAELARRAHEGDRDAFGTLVERYADSARRVCRTILRNQAEADDAAQEGFLNALVNVQTYDPGRPFGPWLMRIVANAARDALRRRRVRDVDELSGDEPDRDPQPDRQAELADLGKHLSNALWQLDERQRIAVVLFEIEGYAHGEIAEVLEVPIGTVRSDVHHAKRRLRRLLDSWKEE